MDRDRSREDYIELKSGEFTEILERVPHWTIRSGITIIFGFILTLVLLSLFVRYPDQIIARATMGTKTPTSSIKSKSTGIIKLLIHDKQDVNRGQKIAIIQNSGSYSDIEKLKTETLKLLKNANNTDLTYLSLDRTLVVGELQNGYLKVIDYINQINRFYTTGIPNVDRKSVLDQISTLNYKDKSYDKLNKAKSNLLKLELEQFKRDSILFEKRVISAAEFEASKKRIINLSSAQEEANLNKSSNAIQLNQMHSQFNQNIKQTLRTFDELKNAFILSLNELSNDIDVWESKYILLSPIKGKASLPMHIVEDSYVSQGDEIMKIVPYEHSVVANVFLNSSQMVEVKNNQDVILKLDNYPFVDYGIVRGKVSYISLVPIEGFYNIKISFDSDVVISSTGKQLEINQDMGATVEIISKNISVFKRIFNNILKAIS